MPSFDVVSEVNLQEVDNAVNQAEKEIAQRYDFKGKKTEIVFDKAKAEIKIAADDESRLNALHDVLISRLFKRGVELNNLDVGKTEQVGGMMLRQTIRVRQGLEQDQAKMLIKSIKETKLKVEAQIQDRQVRVTGKNIDDLQAVIAMLREKSASMHLSLQYINMRK